MAEATDPALQSDLFVCLFIYFSLSLSLFFFCKTSLFGFLRGSVQVSLFLAPFDAKARRLGHVKFLSPTWGGTRKQEHSLPSGLLLSFVYGRRFSATDLPSPGAIGRLGCTSATAAAAAAAAAGVLEFRQLH